MLLVQKPWFITYVGKVQQNSQLKNLLEVLAKRQSLMNDKIYLLVLEYAEGGTLGKYLRDDAMSFEWDNQLRFAKEIAMM
ncbi:kinase-like domain-containing protein [Rhizophagus clarus]|uniref:Kinase-like domain-containing protein n=1 Tax=Rhizophagus clarus TaxID=94130 RepID=A0A8H3LTK9_9GLOM|nr:kinase-like domain-containing protein [Rhizophagus clarus]